MLLRWLVDQYVRDAAQGKLREVVADIASGSSAGKDRPDTATHSKAELPSGRTAPSPTDEFLPCQAAFLFALSIESGGLTDLLQGAEISRHAHGVERAGKLVGREVAVVEAGVGQQAVRRATLETIKFYQPKWVISAGFGGGLHETVRRGHIVMATDVVNVEGRAIATDLSIDEESVAGTKGLHLGRLVTVDGIVRQPEERKALAEKYSALVCDMESFAVAEACREQGVPFLAVRVISDAVDDQLPPEIEHLLKQKSLAGKLGAAAGAVLQRFSAAKDLWKLREDALKASDRLAKFLVGMVERLPYS